MKIPSLLAPSYLHSPLIKDKIKESDSQALTHFSVNTLEGLIGSFADDSENPQRDMLVASMRIRKAEAQCRIYRKMVQYPGFHRQLIDFHRLMLDYGLTLQELPADTEGQTELKRLLETIHDLPFLHRQELRFVQAAENTDFSGAELAEGWVGDLHQQRLLDLIVKQGAVRLSLTAAQPETTRFYKALNSRQEAEGAAQLLIREAWRPEDVMIILCDPERDSSLLCSVLKRYDLPAALISCSRPSKILRCFIALVNLAMNPGIESYRLALEQRAFPVLIPEAYLQYLDQFVFDMDTLRGPVDHVNTALQNNSLLSAAEKENLLRLEAQAQAAHEKLRPFLEPFLSPKSLQDQLNQSYELLRQHHSLKDEQERRMLLQLKAALEDCWDLLDDPENVRMLAAELSQRQIHESQEIDGRIAVTDLKHPLPSRKLTILVGADQNSFPGNSAFSGIFDEDYLHNTRMPSQADRYDHYMKQLDWIYTSASQMLIYSYSAGNYEGKSWDAAFEIEQRAAMRAQLWPLLQNDTLTPQYHHLSEMTARRLFVPDQTLRGSISSFETYFQCPYAYFLKSGLRLSKGRLTGISPAVIGTIQHALLEHLIKEKGKQYADSGSEEISAVLSPYFSQLTELFPDQKLEIQQIQKRMTLNMTQLLEALSQMEQNTSFTPAWQEYRFDEDLTEIDGITVHLKGIIDRIDTCLDDLRILDYKSSAKTLSDAKVKAGLQLQLLTYLIIASRRLGKDPLGAYYCSLKNETLSVSENVLDGRKLEIKEIEREMWLNELQNTYKLNGWTMKESDSLDYDGTHVQGLACKNGKVSVRSRKDFNVVQEIIIELYQILVRQITAGRIDLDPVEGACLFCDYRPVCRLRKAARKPAALVGNEKEGEADADNME